MRVAMILDRKGHSVATIETDATILDASRALTSHGVGALVVSNDSVTIDGILSERDIARALADHGDRVSSMAVRALMATPVVTCRPTDHVDHLMGVMTERRFRHLPVVDDGRLVGLISIGDVVKHRVDELEAENSTLHEYIEQGR